MNEPIDWPLLAQRLAVRDHKGYGSDHAMAALEMIVGEEAIRQSVDYYIALKPEAELARQVLWRLRPWSAMQRCYEIYHSDADIEHRRTAIELLRVVADERALDWIEEFLADPDQGIQGWGIGVLDQLLWGGSMSPNGDVPEKAERLLVKAEGHHSPHVQSLAVFIRGYLEERKSSSLSG